MNKQQKIDAMHEKIANKELSFGNKIIVKTKYSDEEDFVIDEVLGGASCRYTGFANTNHIVKIIGHPVMIGDVMDYFNFEIFPIVHHNATHGTIDVQCSEIITHWTEKRKPIEDQGMQNNF